MSKMKTPLVVSVFDPSEVAKSFLFSLLAPHCPIFSSSKFVSESKLLFAWLKAEQFTIFLKVAPKMKKKRKKHRSTIGISRSVGE